VAGLGGPAPYWNTYAIDPATGNRTSEVQNPTSTSGTAIDTTYAYPAAGTTRPHAVSSVTSTGASPGTSSYGYDADGNTTARPNQTLTHDANGRVSSISSGTSTQHEVYDSSGNLLLQTDPVAGSTLCRRRSNLRPI
jgi:YD repeat-containing protein